MPEIKLMIAIYIFFMIVIGILSHFKIKNISDYYVSGKKGSWWQVSGSLFATVVGGSAILGTIELSREAGWAAICFLGSASAGLFVLGLIAPKVSRLGHYTLPEMLGLFYGTKAERTASLMIPVAWLGIISVQIIAGAKTLDFLNIVSYSQGTLLCGSVFILYTILGGQKSILRTDFVQALLILGGLIILMLLSYRNNPAGLLLPPGTETFFNEKFSIADLFFLLISYSVTFVVGPDIYSRIFCAKNEKTARRSAFLVAALIIPVAFILTYLGLTASGVSSPPVNDRFFLPGISFLSPWTIGIISLVMLSAIMSSADTTLLNTSIILSELITGNLDKKESLPITRIFIILTGASSILISVKITSILDALLISLSFFSGAFILPVIAGIAGWRVNNKLVYAAIISGGCISLAGKIVNEFFNVEWGYFLVILAYFVNALLLFMPPRKTATGIKPEDQM